MKKADQLFPDEINFLSEQDGVPELKLKTRLADFFSSIGSVTRAYLARIDYGDPNEFNVSLCIRIEAGQSDDIIDGINRIFADMFRTAEHLDVLLLTEEREAALLKVCTPFFKREANTK